MVFGATSFVGQILCRRLVDRQRAGWDGAWAMAGRSAEKLAEVAADVGARVDHILADAHDAKAMAALCASAKVVISTVGPYALYGSAVVEAVVEAGIDYCDLTGEPQWMQRMIDSHHDRAVETGARVVHACGFDSVPSDLGLWFLQREAQEALGESCVAVRKGVKAMKGGASGGTIASMMNLMEEIGKDPRIRHVIGNPYALAQKGDRRGPRQPSLTKPAYDNALGIWTAPFVMAATNTRVVLRTHSLLGRVWGEDFTYGEAMMTGTGMGGLAKAVSLAGTIGGVVGVAAFAPTRGLLARMVPQPGAGPTLAQQEAGFFDLRFHGSTATGNEIRVKVTGDREPGYGSTSKMLAEAALTLLATDRSEVGGGFWTPATALGDRYIDALEANAGLSFAVL